MSELEISINNSSAEPEADLRSVLADFEERQQVSLNCSVIDWGSAWSEVMKIVLYKHGPVVSQVGSTWMGSLESTDGLRPYQSQEIKRMGGADAFHPASWRSGVSQDATEVISIPWILDTYLLYYRRGIFDKLGIDETSAFASYPMIEETVSKLFSAGQKIPLAMPTAVSSRASLHNLASWVWSHGGDFVAEDGRKLLWSEPKTREGLKAYFSLYRYMPRAAQELSDSDSYRVFLDGSAAITLRNAGVLHESKKHPGFQELEKNVGVAVLPEISFIGGSNLVIWKHAQMQEEKSALALIEHLTSVKTQYAFFQRTGVLPARLDALKILENNSTYAPVVQAILTGRSLRKLQLWGLIEDKLSAAIGVIWKNLYTKENPDISREIAEVLDPLESRLNLTLSNI